MTSASRGFQSPRHGSRQPPCIRFRMSNTDWPIALRTTSTKHRSSVERFFLNSWSNRKILSQLIVNGRSKRPSLTPKGPDGILTRVSSCLKSVCQLLRKIAPCLRHPTPHRSPKSSRQWPVPTTCVAGPSRMHLPGLAVPLPPLWQSCARRPPDGAGQPELRSRRSRCSPSCRDHPGGFPHKRARKHEGAN